MKTATIISTIITLLVTSTSICDSARILAVIPMFSKSHHYVIQPIIQELAARGHELTFYTGIKMDKNVKNIRELEIKSSLEERFGDFDFNTLRQLGEIPWFKLITFWPFGLSTVNESLQHPEMQKLVHSNEKYDLVLLEANFGQEALLALGHKFQAPIVSLGTFSSFIFIDEFFGNPFGTAYIPGFELPYTDKMTFFQRLHNTVRVISTMLIGYYFYLPYQESVMRQYFNYTGAETIPPVVEMLKDISLMIVNSQISVDYPRAWVPNVIGVSGLHIKPNKELPLNLKEFLDKSSHGFIYVSFGSVVPSEKMPEEMRQAFVHAFSQLKFNVLWKIGLDSIPGLSANVKIGKWFPQQDILAHPKCKAFITHGGLLSQQEAVHFSVPLIGVPFFGDQYMNVERAAAAGFAVSLNQYNITKESLLWALNEITTNRVYRDNIQKHSQIFRDNPQPPIKKAMYWIEYVLRHKGAPHLRSEARKLSWIKYLLLDVIAFICLILFGILFIFYLVTKFIISLFTKKTQSKVKPSKKRN